MAGTIIYGIDGKNQIWEVDATAGASQIVNANPGVDGKAITGASNAFAYDTARDQFFFVDSSARLLFWDRTSTGTSSLKVVETASQLGVSKLPNDAAFYNNSFWFIADGTTKLTQVKLNYDSATGLPTFSSQATYQITGTSLPNLSFGDVAINQKTGVFYGATSGGAFFAIDLNNLGAANSVGLTTIKASGNPSLQISFDGDYTNLYGVNVNDGSWYKINTTTGVAAKTGKVTVGFNDIGGSATTSAVGLDTAYADEAGGVLNQTPGHDATGNVLNNDTGVGLKVSGFAFGATAGTIGQPLAGAYGSVVIQSDGSFVYKVDNKNPAVESLLSSAQTVTDVFDYTAKDVNGASNTTQLRIIIHGANDAPVAVADWDGPIAAGNSAPGGNQASGNVLKNDADVDKGDTHKVSAVAHNDQQGVVGAATAGDYGSVIISADGSYTYTLDNNNSAVKALVQGQSLKEVFQYTNKDEGGLTSSSTLTIEIQGPVSSAPIANPDTSSSPGARVAVEKGGYDNNTGGQSALGNVLLNDTNANPNDTLSVSAVSFNGVAGLVGQAISGNYGELILNKDGGYEYVVDDNSPVVEALNVGDTLFDTFTYTAQNSQGLTSSTTLTIKILGANDAPVANPVVAGPIIVGAQNSVSGDVLANDTDVDKNDIARVSSEAHGATKGVVGQQLLGDYGSLVLQTDGTFIYNIDPNNIAVKALKSGDEIKDVFTYTHVDGGGLTATSTLTIAIFGNGSINISPPVVAPDTSTSPGAAPAIEKGGYNNNTPGQNATGNVLANDAGNNANDKLIVSAVAFNGFEQAAGAAVHGNYGTLILGADGAYSYAVDDNSPVVQALNVGDTLFDIFTYTAQNSQGLTSSTTLNIKILGANDAPVANPVVAGPIIVGAQNSVIGDVLANDTDIDKNDIARVSAEAHGTTKGVVGQPLSGDYGSLVLQSDGTFIYNVDPNNAAVKALKSGDEIKDVFTYTHIDAGGLTATSTLTIAIFGNGSVNINPPVVTPDTSLSPGAAPAIEKGGYNNNMPGQNATGNVLANDAGNNANDQLIVSAVGFNGFEQAAGAAIHGNYGTLILGADGNYTYVVDDNSPVVQALNIGDSLYDAFTYTAQNSEGLTSSTTLNIKILGANDAPVANPVVAGPIIVGAQNSVLGDVLANDTDIDKNDIARVSEDAHGITKGVVGQPLSGDYGSLVLQSDGTFIYNVDPNNAAVKALKSGDEIKDVFTYTHIDGGGLTATSTLTIAIFGDGSVNISPPVVTADTSASVGAAPAIEKGGYNNNTPGQNATGNVLANDTSNNNNDVLTVSVVSFNGAEKAAGSAVHGNYGTLVLGADGNYTYVVDDYSPVVQALNVGDSLFDTFTYTAQNSLGLTSSTTLSIKILGANDAPIANPVIDGPIVAGNYALGGNQALGNLVANDSDFDFGDTLKVSSFSFNGKAGVVGSYIAGNYGWLAVKENGDYAYILDNTNAAVKALPSGQFLNENFAYTEVDAGGLSATSNLTVKIVGSAVYASAPLDDHGAHC